MSRPQKLPNAVARTGRQTTKSTDAPIQRSVPPELTTQALARPALSMALGTALSRLTGLGRIAAMTFALGVSESRLADSYNVANTLPNVIYELVLGGILTSVFLPVLIEQLRTRDEPDARRAVWALISSSLLILVLMTAITVLLAPWIISLFSGRVGGNEGAKQHSLATLLLLLFAPQIALYGLVAIGDALLNAHGRFALPAFAPILNNVITIAVFLVFAALVSGTPTNSTVEASLGEKLLLGLGTTGGVAAMAAAYWPAIRRLPIGWRWRLEWRHPAVRQLARLSTWTLAYVATNVAGWVVSFYLANAIKGGPTAYATAFAFFQLPIGIAAISVITALTPKLAAHHVDGDHSAFRARIVSGLRLTALLMLPATAGYLVLAGPLMEILLAHGVATAHSAAKVASVLRWFAVGLLPFAAFQLLMRGFYAAQDARTPAVINLVENAATIALGLTLFGVLQVRGLALAHTAGYVLGCAIAWRLLARRLGGLDGRQMVRELAKVAAASASAGGGMVLAVAGAGQLGAAPGTEALLQLLAAAPVGLIVFLTAAQALRVRDLSVLGTQLRGALPFGWRLSRRG